MTAITRQVESTLADIFTFVRSQEANQALAAVTFEQLLEEQILVNGETADSKAAQFNPYSFDPTAPTPASKAPLARANFAGGSDIHLATKMDRLSAMESELDGLIDQLKKTPINKVNGVPLDEVAGALDQDDIDPSKFGGN